MLTDPLEGICDGYHKMFSLSEGKPERQELQESYK